MQKKEQSPQKGLFTFYKQIYDSQKVQQNPQTKNCQSFLNQSIVKKKKKKSKNDDQNKQSLQNEAKTQSKQQKQRRKKKSKKSNKNSKHRIVKQPNSYISRSQSKKEEIKGKQQKNKINISFNKLKYELKPLSRVTNQHNFLISQNKLNALVGGYKKANISQANMTIKPFAKQNTLQDQQELNVFGSAINRYIEKDNHIQNNTNKKQNKKVINQQNNDKKLNKNDNIITNKVQQNLNRIQQVNKNSQHNNPQKVNIRQRFLQKVIRKNPNCQSSLSSSPQPKFNHKHQFNNNKIQQIKIIVTSQNKLIRNQKCLTQPTTVNNLSNLNIIHNYHLSNYIMSKNDQIHIKSTKFLHLKSTQQIHHKNHQQIQLKSTQQSPQLKHIISSQPYFTKQIKNNHINNINQNKQSNKLSPQQSPKLVKKLTKVQLSKDSSLNHRCQINKSQFLPAHRSSLQGHQIFNTQNSSQIFQPYEIHKYYRKLKSKSKKLLKYSVIRNQTSQNNQLKNSRHKTNTNQKSYQQNQPNKIPQSIPRQKEQIKLPMIGGNSASLKQKTKIQRIKAKSTNQSYKIKDRNMIKNWSQSFNKNNNKQINYFRQRLKCYTQTDDLQMLEGIKLIQTEEMKKKTSQNIFDIDLIKSIQKKIQHKQMSKKQLKNKKQQNNNKQIYNNNNESDKQIQKSQSSKIIDSFHQRYYKKQEQKQQISKLSMLNMSQNLIFGLKQSFDWQSKKKLIVKKLGIKI